LTLIAGGPAGFAAPVKFEVGPGISDVALVDTTGDGRLDLVLADRAAGLVVVNRNLGGGRFGPPHPYRTGAGPLLSDGAGTLAGQAATAGTAADRTGPDRTGRARRSGRDRPRRRDGRPAVGPGIGRAVQPRPPGDLGPCPGRPLGRLYTGTSPSGIAVADLVPGGPPDLIVADEGSDEVTVLIGRGTGDGWTMIPGPRLKVGAGPTATMVVDVSGTGRLDLLVSDSRSDDVRLLRGLGNGFFADRLPVIFPTGVAPGPMFVANFSGRPGQLDLVTLNAGSNDLSLFADINGGNTVAREIGSNGSVFGGTEGIEAAILISLGAGTGTLGVEGPGSSNLGGGFGEAGEIGGVGIGGGSEALPSGPGEQQVVFLQPEGGSALALAATIFSVSIEPMAGTPAALPNQPTGAGGGVDALDESDPAAPPPQPPGPEAMLFGFLAGLDDAFDRARRDAGTGSPFGGEPAGRLAARSLGRLESAMARWAPAAILGGPVPTMAASLGRLGLAAARSIGIPPRAGGPILMGPPRPAGAPETGPDRAGDGPPSMMGLIGFAAIVRAMADRPDPSRPRARPRGRVGGRVGPDQVPARSFR